MNNRFPTQEEWEKRCDLKALFDRAKVPDLVIDVSTMPDYQIGELLNRMDSLGYRDVSLAFYRHHPVEIRCSR